jgi:hypothetical protein
MQRWKRLLPIFTYWLIIYGAITLLYYAYIKANETPSFLHKPNFLATELINNYECKCQVNRDDQNVTAKLPPKNIAFNTMKRRILFLANNLTQNKHLKSILDFLYHLKVPIRLEQHSQNSQLLLEIDGIARFSLIIFEDFRDFHFLPKSQQKLIHEFCTKHSIGIISFTSLNGEKQFNTTEFNVSNEQNVNEIYFTSNWPTKTLIGKAHCPYLLPKNEQKNWTVLKATSTKFKPLLSAKTTNNNVAHLSLLLSQNHILFCARPEKHWTIKVALLDAINFLSPNIFQEDLERLLLFINDMV